MRNNPVSYERPRLPFAHLGPRAWGRLGCAALGLLLFLGYGAHLYSSITDRGLFGYVGIDYRVWCASAGIIRHHGFLSLYDLCLQAEYQRPLYEQYDRADHIKEPLWTLPLAYPPIFMLPAPLLTYLSPIAGLVLFAFLNTLILLLYLWYFVRRIGPSQRSVPLLLALLALPVLQNLLFAQVNFWLLIALGESLMALRVGRDLRAGVWLAGLLLKPQTVILFIPCLLFRKNYRALAGLVVAGSILAIASLLLVGPTSVPKLLELVSQWPQSLVVAGINWRALAFYSSQAFSPDSASVILLLGTIATCAAACLLWLPKAKVDHSSLYLGTYAAACAVSWHGHVHIALPMLAPGIVLWAEGKLPSALAFFWLFVPTALFLAVAFTLGARLAYDVAAMTVLAANLVVLGWTVLSSKKATGVAQSFA